MNCYQCLDELQARSHLSSRYLCDWEKRIYMNNYSWNLINRSETHESMKIRLFEIISIVITVLKYTILISVSTYIYFHRNLKNVDNYTRILKFHYFHQMSTISKPPKTVFLTLLIDFGLSNRILPTFQISFMITFHTIINTHGDHLFITTW